MTPAQSEDWHNDARSPLIPLPFGIRRAGLKNLSGVFDNYIHGITEAWRFRPPAASKRRESNFQLSPRTVIRPDFVRSSSVLSPCEVRCTSVLVRSVSVDSPCAVRSPSVRSPCSDRVCAERLSVASPYMSVFCPLGVRSQSVFWLLEGRGGLGRAG